MNKPNPSLAILAAVDHQQAIGRGMDIPWHLPDDFIRFKRLTTGKAIIMGWNTAFSLGRALPNRRNMVISRSRKAPWDGMETHTSIQNALSAAPNQVGEHDEVMIIGGAAIYAQAMDQARKFHLTVVHGTFEGCDVFFPEWDRKQWRICAWEHHRADSRHSHAFDYIDLERIDP